MHVLRKQYYRSIVPLSVANQIAILPNSLSLGYAKLVFGLEQLVIFFSWEPFFSAESKKNYNAI